MTEEANFEFGGLQRKIGRAKAIADKICLKPELQGTHLRQVLCKLHYRSGPKTEGSIWKEIVRKHWTRSVKEI
jgi:hypothetical protein